jgi:hypothetical protein
VSSGAGSVLPWLAGGSYVCVDGYAVAWVVGDMGRCRSGSSTHHFERIFGDGKIPRIRPCCAAFRHALEEPNEPPDWLGPSPPIPPTFSEV